MNLEDYLECFVTETFGTCDGSAACWKPRIRMAHSLCSARSRNTTFNHSGLCMIGEPDAHTIFAPALYDHLRFDGWMTDVILEPNVVHSEAVCVFHIRVEPKLW